MKKKAKKRHLATYAFYGRNGLFAHLYVHGVDDDEIIDLMCASKIAGIDEFLIDLHEEAHR
jgi:hypothetical protein